MIPNNKYSEILFKKSKLKTQRGVIKCAKCGTTDVDVKLEQRRSADEAQTLIITCNLCKHKDCID